jgi:hypothetical protein
MRFSCLRFYAMTQLSSQGPHLPLPQGGRGLVHGIRRKVDISVPSSVMGQEQRRNKDRFATYVFLITRSLILEKSTIETPFSVKHRQRCSHASSACYQMIREKLTWVASNYRSGHLDTHCPSPCRPPRRQHYVGQRNICEGQVSAVSPCSGGHGWCLLVNLGRCKAAPGRVAENIHLADHAPTILLTEALPSNHDRN